MKSSSLKTVFTLFLLATVSGCATRLSNWQHESDSISVGEDYEIRQSSVLFGIRGYISSIRPTERTKDRLRSYKDYDPYYMVPMSDIPAGTIVKIHRIHKTWNGHVFVTAIYNDEKVDITYLVQPTEESSKEQ